MIEGTLVNLRPRELADVERNARWWADPDIKWLTGDRYDWSRAAAEASMREIAGKPVALDHVWLAIETKDGVHIGNCRLFAVSAEDRSAKLGISIGEEVYRSHGYGSDAVRTLVRFAFAEMNLNRVELDVFDYNDRAIACYRKCGFVEEGRRRQARYARGVYHDTVVMAVLRDGWRAADD
ncbi:MAG TPA: GNAT family protein [Dehalococcoidia bacterium]|nr:GNAT family protein [Dehalococcoidia bacterium]